MMKLNYGKPRWMIILYLDGGWKKNVFQLRKMTIQIHWNRHFLKEKNWIKTSKICVCWKENKTNKVLIHNSRKETYRLKLGILRKKNQLYSKKESKIFFYPTEKRKICIISFEEMNLIYHYENREKKRESS